MNGRVAKVIRRIARRDGRPGLARALKRAYTLHETAAVRLVRMVMRGALRIDDLQPPSAPRGRLARVFGGQQ